MKASGVAWRVANIVMMLVFVASALVQLNDPDPLAWTAMYAAAAVICGLELTGRLRATYPMLLGLTALAWAATIAPRVLGKVPFRDMFAEFEMRDLGIEESREMYGLLIVAVWMGVLAYRRARRVPNIELE